MLEFDDPARMRAMVGRMAERPTVTVPLACMYWGADFGVQWMFGEAAEGVRR
jgi:hypothetical protein